MTCLNIRPISTPEVDRSVIQARPKLFLVSSIAENPSIARGRRASSSDRSSAQKDSPKSSAPKEAPLIKNPRTDSCSSTPTIRKSARNTQKRDLWKRHHHWDRCKRLLFPRPWRTEAVSWRRATRCSAQMEAATPSSLSTPAGETNKTTRQQRPTTPSDQKPPLRAPWYSHCIRKHFQDYSGNSKKET